MAVKTVIFFKFKFWSNFKQELTNVSIQKLLNFIFGDKVFARLAKFIIYLKAFVYIGLLVYTYKIEYIIIQSDDL